MKERVVLIMQMVLVVLYLQVLSDLHQNIERRSAV